MSGKLDPSLISDGADLSENRMVDAGEDEAMFRSSIPQKVITRITPEPRIPPMPRSWKLVNATQDGDMRYSVEIRYAEHRRDDRSPSITGSTKTTSFTIDFENVVQGGLFALHVWVPVITNEGVKTTLRELVISSIRGINPAKADVRAHLGQVELQVICYKETRFRQFDNEGLPMFGAPRGFGLMQLDTPPPTARQIWDWKENVHAGKALFQQKTLEVKQHFHNVATAYPEAPALTVDEFKLAVYQYYNGGFYWKWDSVQKKWAKVDTTGYADDAVRIERLVIAGTPPADWD